jgi:hypothetical protein
MDLELAALVSSLENQREHVLGILDGLTDEQLRRPVLPSGWTCLGMVSHLTISVERFWFQGVFAGAPIELTVTDELSAAAWQVDPTVSAEDVFAVYRYEAELANTIVADASVDTAPSVWPDIWPDWRLPDLRAIMLHVITETACHAGHLDAARELLDGSIWTK